MFKVYMLEKKKTGEKVMYEHESHKLFIVDNINPYLINGLTN